MILTADIWNIFWTGVGIGIGLGGCAVIGVFVGLYHAQKKKGKK